MTPRSGTLVAVMLCGVVFAATAAPPQTQPRQPGQEHARLDYFAGKWQYEAEMKAGPLGPGGTVTNVETCQWFAGRFHLVCRSDGTGPMGELHGLGIMSWSAESKRYTYHGINNLGDSEQGTGTLEGRSWTWTGESSTGGTLMKSRSILQEAGPDAYTYKWEVSVDGGPWTLVMDGQAKRLK